jgi:hypothetical protein
MYRYLYPIGQIRLKAWIGFKIHAFLIGGLQHIMVMNLILVKKGMRNEGSIYCL